VHEADTTVEAGEILGEITGWIVEDTALAVCVAAAGTALQLVSAALTPIIIGIGSSTPTIPTSGWPECRPLGMH
jgi:hypothetical protein